MTLFQNWSFLYDRVHWVICLIFGDNVVLVRTASSVEDFFLDDTGIITEFLPIIFCNPNSSCQIDIIVWVAHVCFIKDNDSSCRLPHIVVCVFLNDSGSIRNSSLLSILSCNALSFFKGAHPPEWCASLAVQIWFLQRDSTSVVGSLMSEFLFRNGLQY